MAQINFFAGQTNQIFDLSGSGLGFYGPGGFGTSVQVGQYQDNTFITDPTGAVLGPQVTNVKYISSTSGQVPVANTLPLLQVTNQLATLNIRFTHTAAVNTQNAVVRIFDRNDIGAPASGVETAVAEIIHPWSTQTPNGSGDSSWSFPGGSGGTINGVTYDPPVSLVDSPGSGGWTPNGAAGVQHDWYLAISASPSAIGSRSQYGLWAYLEYV